jgi:DNA modification methylase
MAYDTDRMQKQINGRKISAQVFHESFFLSWEKLPADSIDLIITSPPYLNNYHYNRNTRPHLYWLGYAHEPKDFKLLEEQNFGTYWQTVRERACIDLAFHLDDGEIRECVQELRAKTPEKGIYGGNGWANYAAAYFNDCYRFSKAAQHILKRRGTALVVIGNSILQGVMIPTDRYLGKIAASVGLELVDIHIPRATRVGNSIIQSEVRVVKAQASHQLYEAVVELRKR